MQEILDEVHKAMGDGLILQVQFDCVKCTLYFRMVCRDQEMEIGLEKLFVVIAL